LGEAEPFMLLELYGDRLIILMPIIIIIIIIIIENYIDGSEFFNLTDSEIKSMIPPIGLQNKIIRLLPKSQV